MSTIGDLLFGSGPTPQVSTSTSNTSQPLWLQQFYQALLSKGSQAANAPYTANPNPQVAPLTADQNQAYSNVEAMQGAQQPLLNTASSFAQSAGSPIDAAQINNYLNPYTQNVVDTIGSLAGRNLSENLLPAVNDTFTRSGQFGSRGNFDLTERTIRDSNESALNAQSQALQSGYNTALSAAQQDQTNKISAAGTLGNLASTGQNIGLQGAAALEAAGQSQQSQGQKNLDVINQEWQQQQDYPKNQVSWLSSLFNPNGAGQTTTSSSSTTPSTNNPSPLSGIIGSIGSIGSLIGSLFAEGGAVRYADGGEVLDTDPNYIGDAPAGDMLDRGLARPSSPEMDAAPDTIGDAGARTIGDMLQPAPDPDSIARGNAEIVRRAKVAMAKPKEAWTDVDAHAVQMYQLLMQQGVAAPQQLENMTGPGGASASAMRAANVGTIGSLDQLENATGPGGADASIMRAQGMQGPQRAVERAFGPNGFDANTYYQEHGYNLGENPATPTFAPIDFPRNADDSMVLKRRGGRVRRYDAGGSVASTPDTRRAKSGAATASLSDRQDTARMMFAARLMANGTSYEDAWDMAQHLDVGDPDRIYDATSVLQFKREGGSIGSLKRAA